MSRVLDLTLEGATQQEIADELGWSRGRVQRAQYALGLHPRSGPKGPYGTRDDLRGPRAPDLEERIARYRERAKKGLPLFG